MMNNYDDFIEREIFEFAKNDKSVPSFVDEAIRSAINRVKPANRIFYKIKKMIIFILSLGIMATSVVFAKDIVEFFKSIFTNSTPGINSAIENGEVHNIDMNFVYSNNIGIKVNSIVEDDNVIDIAFVFDCPKESGITNIFISNIDVTDNNGKIVNSFNEDGIDYINSNGASSKSITIMNDFKVIDNLYYKSILVKVGEEIKVQNLKLNISQIQIFKNKEVEDINGNWNFDLNLIQNEANLDELVNEENDSFNVKYNSDIIKEISYEINDTNFIINIAFSEKIDLFTITDVGNIILSDNLKNEIEISSANIDDKNFKIRLGFDFGKYNLSENLNLYIKYDENKETTIEFYK